MHVHTQKIKTRTNNTIPDTILIHTEHTTLVLLDTYQGPAYTLMILATRLKKNLRSYKEYT
jgi:hypothetical protein